MQKNLTPDQFNTQKRGNLKNAKFVLALKESFSVQFGHYLPIYQLQQKIKLKKGDTLSKWKNIRTFKLSGSRKVHFVVVGVKS